MRWAVLLTSIWGFLIFPAQAQLWQQRYEHHFQWGKDVIDAELMQKLIQEFSDQYYDKSFRYIGDSNDWFHGHLLYSEDLGYDESLRMKPYAVLYHTQEEAYANHRDQPGGRYDYLNPHTRNWLQFFDSQKKSLHILNAFLAMKDFFPNTESFRGSLEATKSHFTVFSDQLDYKKFPSNFQYPMTGTLQVNFYECASKEDLALKSNYWTSGGSIRIKKNHLKEETCLNLYMATGYMPQQSFYEAESETLINDAIPEEFLSQFANSD